MADVAMIHYSRGRGLHDNRPAQRTAADMAGFIAQLDADRAPSKQGAAYVCGPLSGDGRRCAGGALPRRWVAVDLDRIEPTALVDVLRLFQRHSAAAWPTHSSTPAAPRLRIIIELEHPASRDQCIAIGKTLDSELRAKFGNKVLLDGCTFRPEQAVLVPPTEAVIQRFNGAPLAVPAATAAAGTSFCTEEHRGLQKPSSVSSVQGGVPAWAIPPATIPTDAGKRNDCLFALARHVRRIQPAPTRDELRCIVQAWHTLALPAIQTQDFAVSFAEFMHGYERVKQPHGATMETIIGNINNTPLPAGIDMLGYGAAGNQLVKVCAALQAHEGDGVFFLGARQAGELVGVPFTDANRMMQALVLDGVIVLVTKGAGKKASRYRFVWPAASGVFA